jgi:hypothetical protein
MAILIISALGFLVASLIFYAGIGSRQPGPESPYLGHNGATVLSTYYEAESRLLFIDESARLSWKTSNNNLEAFKQSFQKYLDNFNLRYGTSLSLSDYEFFFKDGYLKARCSKELTINYNFVSYSFSPSFRIKAEQPATESVSLV